MPDWLIKFLEQRAVVAAAPIPFAIAVVIIGALIWIAISWSYGSVLNSKNAQIELLDRQVTDWKQKTAEKTPDDAKARIDALEARIGRIEPRRLSAEQRRIIADLARIPSGSSYSVSIQSDMSCADCGQFAADFLAALTDASWTIRMPKILGASAASPKGIAILTPDPSAPLPEATALMRALAAAKIPFDLKPGSDSIPAPAGPINLMAAMLITARASP